MKRDWIERFAAAEEVEAEAETELEAEMGDGGSRGGRQPRLGVRWQRGPGAPKRSHDGRTGEATL